MENILSCEICECKKVVILKKKLFVPKLVLYSIVFGSCFSHKNVCLTGRSLQRHLGSDGTRLKQNAQARLKKVYKACWPCACDLWNYNPSNRELNFTDPICHL